METISNNVKDVQDLAAQFETQGKITTRFPDSLDVELPGGFIAKDGSVVKFATVRELTGADEEAIARSSVKGLTLNAILVRGLDKLGYNTPTLEDIDNLLAGDRDAILLAIRRTTFGKNVDAKATCTSCAAAQDITLDLETDIPNRELSDPVQDRIFEVELRAGKAVVGLPNGLTQKKMMENFEKTTAELTTLFLSSCIISINDEPSIGLSSALNLGILDRELIISEIVDRNPGPRLEAVVKACKACGNDIEFSLSLADLFRL
jgi:hypothetical protein